MNKDFFRAVKVFLKTSFSIFFFVMALFFMVVYILGFMIDPQTNADKKEYHSMLGAMVFGYYFMPYMFLKFSTNERKKFFRTMTVSDKYMTSVPVFVFNVLAFAYILITMGIVFIRFGTDNEFIYSDMLIYITTGAILANSAILFSSRCWYIVVPSYILIFVIFFSQYPLKFFMTDYTFGLSIGKAAVISVSLFAAAYIIQLIGMKYTYKKGVKIVETEPQNIVGNIKMG